MPSDTPVSIKQSIRCCLLDIEGTTTDIHFVHQVLFPYATQHLETFIAQHLENPDVQSCLSMVQATIQDEQQRAIAMEETVSVLLGWIGEDRKHTALKQLQGMIWKAGYHQGDYQAHVYPDVPVVLQAWQQQGIETGIYSSGSTEAQKLLFAHTLYGDLTPAISHYFDTRIGHKQETGAYKTISKMLGYSPAEILFFSDVAEELVAAENAGFAVLHVIRDLEQTSETVFKSIQSLNQVILTAGS
jgi:enolase-phosphatase E1